MSRSATIIILGAFAVLVLGILAVTVFLFARGYFQVTDQNIGGATSIPSVTAAIVVPTSQPTSTVSIEATVPSATEIPTTVATQPAATAVPATSIVVSTTPVQYVLAQTNVNIRSGPGTGYGVVGWVAEGQTAKVTGISSDSGWWRVVCPDGSTGSCWVSARTQYTQPTNAPGGSPVPTAIVIGCTDSATLISDVTVPDGTRFGPNAGFNKTWLVKNSGTCTWDSSYRLVHAGGHLLGAVSPYFPLRDTVFPGQNVYLTISMVSPLIPDTYQSDWKLQNPQGQFFGVGRNSAPFWARIVVTGPNTTISGVVYQDSNLNGVYDSGEPLMGGQVVWLIPGTACQVRQDPVSAAVSDGNGRYTLNGAFSGDYCVGLAGNNGLDDVVALTVAAGQTLTNINLHVPSPSGSVSGYLWNDYCLTNEDGDALDGNCVADGNGDYHADSMIQPTETYISGVTILLQAGICANNNNVAVSAVTDASGRYFFGNLGPGNYCVSMNAASPENAPLLLPGDWTFPGLGIWYQDVLLRVNENVFPANFGWDYQLK